MQEFNRRSEAVQNLGAEICKTAKQVKELQCKVTTITKRSKTDPGAFVAGHAEPNKPCIVEYSILPVEQPNILGFPVSQNQFQILSENEVQESELSQEQSLEDPRKTRAQTLQTSSRTERREFMQEDDVVLHVPLVVGNNENTSTFIDSFSVYSPVEILYSYSAGNFELEIGDFSDAVYKNSINDVTCTKDHYNKRISDAGPERSVG